MCSCPYLAARALGDQASRAVDTGRVKLHELHILERQTRARRHRVAVASASVGRGGGVPRPACKKINRSHTHTPTENNTPDNDTHTHAHDENNTSNEHLPQALDNARRWRDDGACHLPGPACGKKKVAVALKVP